MARQRVFCIAALMLIAASLLLVALDRIVMPGAEHTPGECPICWLANCLATSALPAAVLLIVQTPASCWTPHEPPRVAGAEFSRRPFWARPPPPLGTA